MVRKGVKERNKSKHMEMRGLGIDGLPVKRNFRVQLKDNSRYAIPDRYSL
jgi:hypothetical protein